MRVTYSLLVALALAPVAAAAQEPDTGKAAPNAFQLDSLVVTGRRQTMIGPLPGLLLRPDQLPTNVQHAGQVDLRESRAESLTEYMDRMMQSVTVNDYQGNPFQQDVVFRGFTASPQIGTPQGLSVFLDGVRVNEPFGDVVNWDMLPLNAIASFDVFPGSNPLFGLNTLGGALSLRTRSGFTDQGADVSALGGSFTRKQVQGAAGGYRGNLAGFAAVNYFDEDGWRDNSPSRVFQGFGRADLRIGMLRLTGTALVAHNNLVGNGLLPFDMWQARPENIFSSPDETRNRLSQFGLSGQLFVGNSVNMTAQLYNRNSDRHAFGGDVYTDGFESFSDRDALRPNPQPHTQPYCQYLDADGNGLPDTDETGQSIILNQPCELNIQIGDGIPRNGAGGDDFLPPLLAGIVGGTPIGVINRTEIGQTTNGAAWQLNFNLPAHKLMLGASIDDGRSSYALSERLASIDATRNVFEDPDHIDPYYTAAQRDILVNGFAGRSTTASAFVYETWSPVPTLDISVSARANRTRVRNSLDTRSASGQFNGDLHDITNRNVRNPHILCPTTDPASCPDEPIPVEAALDTLQAAQLGGTEEIYVYKSLNPSIGVSWHPRQWLNLYANGSRGSRAPSVVELGCALDTTLVNINEGFDIPPQYVARSLVGPTCTLPTALSGDPYLPQIRSTSGEVGIRGALGKRFEWTAALFRTDLSDDIQFVAASPQRSYFQTVGDTRRQGFETGLGARLGRLSLRGSYAYTEATFESTFYMLSPHNSSADFDQNSQPSSAHPTATSTGNGGIGTFHMIRIDPGANLPGVPRHNVNARVDYHILRPWRFGVNMVAHTKSYIRGNENNRHTVGDTDQEQPLWVREPDGVIRPQASVEPGRPFTLAGDVPGFAVFGLTSDLHITRDFSLSIFVNNLFDKDYFSAGRLGTSPFAPSVNGAIGPSGWNFNSGEWTNTSFVAPGAPRGIWVTLDYRFSSGERGNDE